MRPLVYKSENSQVETQKEGHVYTLYLVGVDADIQSTEIKFQEGAVKEVGERNGWQNEELLAVLIDRMIYLDKLVPCKENIIVITKLQEALFWLEQRTKDRQERGVESTNNK